jgi:hypothetical protein
MKMRSRVYIYEKVSNFSGYCFIAFHINYLIHQAWKIKEISPKAVNKNPQNPQNHQRLSAVKNLYKQNKAITIKKIAITFHAILHYYAPIGWDMARYSLFNSRFYSLADPSVIHVFILTNYNIILMPMVKAKSQFIN